jgi:hypothetical protein
VLLSFRVLTVFAVATLLAACATNLPTFPAGEACETSAFSVIDGFSGARRGKCTVLADNHVRLDILPESSGKINDSPWYAFKLSSNSPMTAKITLLYHGGHHRYWPKVSADSLHWTRLDPQQVRSSARGRRAEFEVDLTSDPVWVAGQELITPVIYDIWNRKIARAANMPIMVLGNSTAGLPIHAFDSNAESKEVLFLVGRQHPPEISGAFAFFAFAETILGDSDLAQQFRTRFRIIAIPLLNPDGVVGGNWRNNLGGVDLNRDWGPFTQPETQLMADLLKDLDASDSKIRMFIDFHSTRENAFYALPDVTHPPDFITAWLESARARTPNYPFTLTEGPASSMAIAKNYIYERYGIPAVTFEVGDETDRDVTRAAAKVFAEELMQLMLGQEY